MKYLKNNILLLYGMIFILSYQLQAQNECYTSSYDHIGLLVNRDSLNHYSCEIGETFPETLTESFKVISINEYSLDISKNTVDLNRYKTSFLDSLSEHQPYNLVFWWRPESGKKIGGLDIFLSYPNDEDHNNCFTSAKITLIQRRVEESTRATALIAPDILEAYPNFEKEAIKALLKDIAKVKDCCYDQAKNNDSCSLCPKEDEIGLLKRELRIWPFRTAIPLSNDVGYTGDIILTARAENSSAAKSNNSYEFYDYVQQDLVFGETVINLDGVLEDFVARQEVNFTPTVYTLNDNAFCTASFDANKPNQTFFAFTKDENGNNQLEFGFSAVNSGPTFLNFLIDSLPSIFGERITPGGFGSNEETVDEAAVLPPPNSCRPCFYTRSGAMIYEYNSGSGQENFTISDPYIATPLEYNQPTNALYYFNIGEIKYVAWDFVRKSNRPKKTIGFFYDEELRRRLADGHVYTGAFYPEELFFTDVYPNSVVSEGEDCQLSVFKFDGCNSGRNECSYKATATTDSISRVYHSLVIPPDADCNTTNSGPESVCCSVGIRYVEDHRSGALGDSRLRFLLEDDEQNEALFAIGRIICDIGGTIFHDFGNYDPANLPLPLEFLFKTRLSKIGVSEDFTYLDVLSSFEEYRDSLYNFGIQSVSIEENDWESMVFLMNSMKDADLLSLTASQRYEAIKLLVNNLDSYIVDSTYVTVGVGYGTTGTTTGAVTRVAFKDEGGVNRKRVLYRLISNLNTDLDNSEFLLLLLNDEDLLLKLFRGFNDTNFFGGGSRGQYYELITALMQHLYSSSIPQAQRVGPQKEVVLNLGYLPEPGGTSILNDRCAISLEGDCFGTMTIEWPYRLPVYFPNSFVEFFDICMYHSDFGSGIAQEAITFNGPLDYVPVQIRSSDFGGLLNPGKYLVPAFLLCYLKDDLDRIEANAQFGALITGAVIVLTAITLPATGGSGIGAALLLLDAIDVIGAVAINQINDNIDNGVIRDVIPDQEEYDEFLKTYRKVESGFNTVMLTAAGAQITAAAGRALIKQLDEAGGINHFINNQTASNSEIVRRLNKISEVSKSTLYLFGDLPKVKALILPGSSQADQVYEALTKLDEDVLQQLNRDLDGIFNPGSAGELTDLFSNQPNNLDSYSILFKSDSGWAKDPDIIRQLTEDISNNSTLRQSIIDNGKEGVQAWKALDDSLEGFWCG